MPSRLNDPTWVGKAYVYTTCVLLVVVGCVVSRKRDQEVSSNSADATAVSDSRISATSSAPDDGDHVSDNPNVSDGGLGGVITAKNMPHQSVSSIYKFKGFGFDDLEPGAKLKIYNHTAVVIWLHGLGDEPFGYYTQRLLRELSGPEFGHIKQFAPAAPPQPVTCNRGRRMPSWFDILELPFRAESRTSSWEDVEGVVQFVHRLLEDCIAAGIPSSKIVIGGFSQGAATTLVSSLTFRERLAGGMVLWGWMPVNDASLLARLDPEGRQTPLYWSHGMLDNVVLHENAEIGDRVLREWGVKCTLTSNEFGVHSVSDVEMEAVARWLRLQLPA